MEKKFFLGNPIKTYTLTKRMVIQQRIFHYRILLDASLIEKKRWEQNSGRTFNSTSPGGILKVFARCPGLLAEALIYIMGRRVLSLFLPFASLFYSCSFAVKREAGSYPRVREGTQGRRRIRNRCLALLSLRSLLSERSTSRAAPFFLPFRPSKHDTKPLGASPMPKDRLAASRLIASRSPSLYSLACFPIFFTSPLGWQIDARFSHRCSDLALQRLSHGSFLLC